MNDLKQNEESTGTSTDIQGTEVTVTRGDIGRPITARNVQSHSLLEMVQQLQREGMLILGKPEDVEYGAVLDAQYELIQQLSKRVNENFDKYKAAMEDNDAFYFQLPRLNILVMRSSNGKIKLVQA